MTEKRPIDPSIEYRMYCPNCTAPGEVTRFKGLLCQAPTCGWEAPDDDETRGAYQLALDLLGINEEELPANKPAEPKRVGEWWVIIWTWRKKGTFSWVIENSRLAGCLGAWWPKHVLMHAGQNDYRLMSAVPVCRWAYEQMIGIMPDAVIPEGEIMPGAGA